MIGPQTLEQAAALVDLLRAKGLMAATAESCTGGLVAGALTAIPGSSDVVDRGFVTYSNDAKAQMIGVPPALIAEHGAVSQAVALAMVAGALAASKADVAVAITGIAGPGGGSEAKPVGLVHFAAQRRGQAAHHVERRYGAIGRAEVREASVREALDLLRRVAT